MTVLYLDTSSSYLYGGIIKDAQLLVSVKEKLEKELSSLALPKIIAMLKKVGLSKDEIDEIMIVNGPGSFTGIRVGLTIAKTWAWALEKKIVTVSSLEAMALSVTESSYVVPAIDARRGYVFAGIFKDGTKKIGEESHIATTTLQETLDELSSYIIVTNDEVSLKGEKRPYDPDILRIVQTYQDRPGQNPHAIEPYYLKQTEAEENLEK